MSDTLDYTDLFKGAFSAMREEQPGNRIAPAAAYLRERIEAAFVPVEENERQFVEFELARRHDVARAEAAEARVSELTAQLAEARQAEREAVVAWLSGNATLAQFHWGAPLIAAIEAGVQMQKEGVLPDE